MFNNLFHENIKKKWSQFCIIMLLIDLLGSQTSDMSMSGGEKIEPIYSQRVQN